MSDKHRIHLTSISPGREWPPPEGIYVTIQWYEDQDSDDPKRHAVTALIEHVEPFEDTPR